MRVLALLAFLFATAAHAQVPAPIGPGGNTPFNGLSTTPTANACAGFSLAAGGKDVAGKITYTSATTCSVNFGTTFQNAPSCQVTSGAAAGTVVVTSSTTGFAVTFGAANTAFSYVCIGQ